MSVLGSVLSAPYMIVFYVLWIISCLLRPVLSVCFLASLQKPRETLSKLQLFVKTVEYLISCNDKKWKAPTEDPVSFFPSDLSKAVAKKTVIFVRHGESTWNDSFNRGDRSKFSFLLNFVPNLIKALYYEAYFFVTCQGKESWFFDSPLSEKGKSQARSLQAFLNNTNLDHQTPREAELLKIMVGETPSHMVVSNLRRAIATMAIGFQNQLLDRQNPKAAPRKMVVLPQLQEMSRNPDAQCITPAKGMIDLTWIDPKDLKEIYENQIDTQKFHTGNKPVNSCGLERMQDFCRIIFDNKLMPENAIVVAGHSQWFRSFFKTFLPHTSTHVSKTKKLQNGASVGFTLYQMPNKGGKKDHYLIDPKSIKVVYGGF